MIKNIDIEIPFEGFRFMMKHSVSRDSYSKGNPLYTVYYRHKSNNSLGSCILKISDLALLASLCKFRNYADKKSFEYFLNSLRGVPQEGETNFRWRCQ